MVTQNNDEKLTLVSLRDEIYELLRKRIINHHYPPNYRFDLIELEKRLGISRTPLKEALHRLELEGLVKIRPRRGTFVTDLDPTDIAESFDVRKILESGAAQMVTQTITDKEIDALEQISNQMDFVLDNNTDYQAIVEAYIDLDYEFHRLFMSYTHNNRLIAIHKRINTHLQIARVRQKFLPQQSRHTQLEHSAILMALKARDVQTLQNALKQHIQFSKERILNALKDSG